METHLAFFEYVKAFDKVKRDKLYEILQRKNITVYEYCSAQIFQYTNIAVHKYCSAQILQCTNIAVHKYYSAQICSIFY